MAAWDNFLKFVQRQGLIVHKLCGTVMNTLIMLWSIISSNKKI